MSGHGRLTATVGRREAGPGNENHQESSIPGIHFRARPFPKMLGARRFDPIPEHYSPRRTSIYDPREAVEMPYARAILAFPWNPMTIPMEIAGWLASIGIPLETTGSHWEPLEIHW